jgi:hypothetical protein
MHLHSGEATILLYAPAPDPIRETATELADRVFCLHEIPKAPAYSLAKADPMILGGHIRGKICDLSIEKKREHVDIASYELFFLLLRRDPILFKEVCILRKSPLPSIPDFT